MRLLFSLAVLLAAVCASRAAPAVSLQPRAFEPLPVGSVTPKGWLLKQLEVQAQGLSGHLSLFWADVMNSSWVGGTADGGLHERTPYWLNGIVPLAYLLRNANSSLARPPQEAAAAPLCQNNTDMMYHDLYDRDVSSPAECKALCQNNTNCKAFVVNECTQPPHCWLKEAIGAMTANASCRCFGTVPPRPEPPVNILAQAHAYINYILAHQSDSGWLGPDDDQTGNMYWSKFPVLLSLAAFAEAEPAQAQTVAGAMLKFLTEAERRMHKVPLSSWSMWRGMDLALAVQWLLKHHPMGQETFLADMLTLVRQQTSDWESWFTNFTVGASPHGVNNAQALKSSGVWAVQDADPALHASSRERLRNMDDYYGMASGMFCADEILCEPAQRKMPSRGTELCAVVEAMFSYNTLFSVHGDVAFADRAERIAYNALPATFASPVGGDMWNHQYLQALNEINAVNKPDHVWTHDGGDAEIYGLAPNYGCCTANFNQGWPKYAQMLVFVTADGGAAVGAFAPVAATLPQGATLEVQTAYPYGDTVTIAVNATAGPMPLYVRIPAWAVRATVSVNGGAAQATTAGTMFKASLPKGASSVLLDLKPAVRLEHWYSEDTVTVHRGPLMYSLPVAGNYTVLTEYAFDSKDIQVTPESEWRYALQLDQADPAGSFRFSGRALQPGEVPFNHTNWPATLQAQARVVPSWGIRLNSAAAPPVSPACAAAAASTASPCGRLQNVTLVPYGGTDLRISEMPWA